MSRGSDGPGADSGRSAQASSGPVHLDLESFTEVLEQGEPADLAARHAPSSWRAALVRVAPGQGSQLSRLCTTHALQLADSIENQVADLARIAFPAPHREADRHRFIEQRLTASGDRSAYGRWAWFPWEGKLVHVLPRDAYFDVLTSRNQDKITRAEQLLLRGKHIGVIGLSVGGEAAVTLAQEHLCGSIRIADFDELELSNLNRLNAGVDELGHNKAHLVARRIAKIDPYLEVRVFDRGIDEDNCEQFLDGLDLLVEECDDLSMKYRLREAARRRRLDVIFAADERGMLSIEPYSRFPELEPFHGLVKRPHAPHESYPSTAAFMRALTDWLGGWEAIPERSRRSVERIGDTLCGYPQLASEPRLAAGQLGHVARRLLLGEPMPPFFAHLDLAEQIHTTG